MLKDSCVLITGGTGSLGEALIPQLLAYNPQLIRVVSNNENEIYSSRLKFPDRRVLFELRDVRDYIPMGVDYVMHAAALKHIDLCAVNPFEAVKTNILGSQNILEMAIECGVKKVIGISSDKAVYPINLYGATKLIMEKLFIQANCETKFACIRFGNFKASRGSFLEKIQDDDVIKVTDVNMKRYWIELEDAARFTINCLNMMNGGEIFIPKMEEIGIMEFVGKRKYEVIGRRKGEKLAEFLINEDESPIDRGDHFVIRSV